MRLVGKDKEARMGGSRAVSSLDLLVGCVRVTGVKSKKEVGKVQSNVGCRV